MLNVFKKRICTILLIAWLIVPVVTLFALLAVPVKADSVALVTGETLTIDAARTPGDTYFMGWYQGQAVTFHDGWFAFDLQPVDTPEINLSVDNTTPTGLYQFLEFTVPRFADPHDFNAWQDVKSFDVNVQRCTGFSPPLPGCENFRSW